jgi:Peptidase family M28
LNLEAMGSKGKEILFQANSPYLVKKYANVPRPHASSLSNDIFATGLLMSDTDFRQFLEYGNLIGLDFAIYQNSYQYHTNLDVIENIELGTIQHFGDNILKIVESLTTNSEEWGLENDSSMIYYDYLGWVFVHYTQSEAMILHSIIALVAVLVCVLQAKVMHLTMKDLGMDVISFFTNIMIGLLATVSFSIFLGQINTMSWFPNEIFPLFLFGPVFLQGLLVNPLYRRGHEFEFDRVERRSWIGACLGMTLLLGLTTYAGIASSYLCKIQAMSLLSGLVVDLVLENGVVRQSMSLWVYAVALIPFIPFGISSALSLLYVFTPILGRVGAEAPVDVIIAIVSSLCLIFSQFYLLVPMSFRMSKSSQNLFVLGLKILSMAIFIVFCQVSPYSITAPKRLYTSFMENTTSGQRGVHISFADTGKNSEVLELVQMELQVKPVLRTARQTDKDWATIFPFSHFVGNSFNNSRKLLF